ncbi:MAG: 50S ribosomal protein L14e [Candidatus Bathyarchaeia archaeon]
MSVIEIGRICVKTKGREAGKRCVVVDIVDKNFVIASGPKELTGVKRRRVNISHLEPTEEKINIKRNATDEEVKKLLGKEEKMT